MPTVPVPRGDGPVAPLPAGDVDFGDLLEDIPELDGLAVVHRGRIVAERYGGEMTEDSLHLSQSVGKSVAGLTAGILAGRGQLDPSSRVTDHVPEVAGSGYDGATVRHLLDMTAAIDFVEDYAVDFWRYDVACAWHPPVPGVPETILEYLPTIGPADWTHGERFHYATPNTDLLGIVLERVADEPLATLIARELWGPVGAERDALLTVDGAGTAAIGGGFCATLRDYARLGLLVAENGARRRPSGVDCGARRAAMPRRSPAPPFRRPARVPRATGTSGGAETAGRWRAASTASSSSRPRDPDRRRHPQLVAGGDRRAREARHRALVAGVVARLT